MEINVNKVVVSASGPGDREADPDRITRRSIPERRFRRELPLGRPAGALVIPAPGAHIAGIDGLQTVGTIG